MLGGMGVPYLQGYVELDVVKAIASLRSVDKSLYNLIGKINKLNSAKINLSFNTSNFSAVTTSINSQITAFNKLAKQINNATNAFNRYQTAINSFKLNPALQPTISTVKPPVLPQTPSTVPLVSQQSVNNASQVSQSTGQIAGNINNAGKRMGFWNTGLGSTVASIGKMFVHMVAFQAISNTVFATWYKFWQIMREGVQLFLEMDKGVGRAMRTGLTPEQIQGYFGKGTPTAQNTEGLNLGGTVNSNRIQIEQMREITTLQGLMFNSEHISNAKDYTEALYQLTSANISMKSSLQIINDVMKVSIAAEGNITETTKTLAGMYNIYKDTIVDVSSEQEKFRQIANTVLYVWAKEQMELTDLNYSLKYVASSARAMGIDYKELIATIGHLHTSMIRGSTAGTGLRQVFNATGQNASALSGLFLDLTTQMRLFGMESAKKNMGAFDPSKPLNLVKVLGSLKQQMEELRKSQGKKQDDPFSLGELQKVMKGFQVRGSNVILTLINSYDAWKQKIKEVKDLNKDYIDQFVKLQELNLQDQMAILSKNIRSIPGAFLLGLENTKDMATALANINAHFKDVIITAYAFGKMAKNTWQDWAAGLSNLGDRLIDISAKTLMWIEWIKSTTEDMNNLTQGNAPYVIVKNMFGVEMDSLKTGDMVRGATGKALSGLGGMFTEDAITLNNLTSEGKEEKIKQTLRKNLQSYKDAFKEFSGQGIDIPDFLGKTSQNVGDTKTAVEDLGVSFNVTGKKFEQEYQAQIDKVIQINQKLDEQNTLFIDQATLLANLNKQDENFNTIRESLLESYGAKFESESEKQLDIIDKISQKVNDLNQNRLDALQMQENKMKGGLTYNKEGQPVGVTNQAMIDALRVEIDSKRELIKVEERILLNKKLWEKSAEDVKKLATLKQEKIAYQELLSKLNEYASLKAKLQGYVKGDKYSGNMAEDSKKYNIPTTATAYEEKNGVVIATKVARSDLAIKNDIKKAQDKQFKSISSYLAIEGAKFATDLRDNFIQSLDVMPALKEKTMADIDSDAKELERQYKRTFNELEKKLDFPGLSGDEKKRKKFQLEFQTNLQDIEGSIQRIKNAIKSNMQNDKLTDVVKNKTNTVQVAILKDYEAQLRDYKKASAIEQAEMEQEIQKKYSDLSLTDEQKRLNAIRDKYKDMLKSSETDLNNHNKVVKAMEEEIAQEKFKIEEELQQKIRDARQKTFDIDKKRAEEVYALEESKAKLSFNQAWQKKFEDAKEKNASPAEIDKLNQEYEVAKSEFEKTLSTNKSAFTKQMVGAETQNLLNKMTEIQVEINKLSQEYARTKDSKYKEQIYTQIQAKTNELKEFENQMNKMAADYINSQVEDSQQVIDEIKTKQGETDPYKRYLYNKTEIKTNNPNVKMELEKPDGGGGSQGSQSGYITGYANYFDKIKAINENVYNKKATSLATLKNARDNRPNQLREELKLKQGIARQEFGKDVKMGGERLNKAGGIWQTLSHALANLTPQIMPKNIYEDPILKGFNRRIALKTPKMDTTVNINVDGKTNMVGNKTRIKEATMALLDETIYNSVRGAA